MFFSILAGSYLHRVPSSCLPGCRELLNLKNAAQVFPLSGLLRHCSDLHPLLVNQGYDAGLRVVASAHDLPLTHEAARGKGRTQASRGGCSQAHCVLCRCVRGLGQVPASF